MNQQHKRKIYSPIERFLKKIQVLDNGCWKWIAQLDQDGYGVFWKTAEKAYRSHRFIYEYYHGHICSDLTIDHLCRNRWCENPPHLELVTNKENVRRGDNFNRDKTHCLQGHPYSGFNLIIRKNGKRECRICKSESDQKYKLRWSEMK